MMAVVWVVALLLPLSSARIVTEPTTIQFTYGIDETLFRPQLSVGGTSAIIVVAEPDVATLPCSASPIVCCWQHSGNGNGEFEMYVNSNRTTYVANRTLFLKPTLTEHVMEDLNAAGTLNVAKSRAFINQTGVLMSEANCSCKTHVMLGC